MNAQDKKIIFSSDNAFVKKARALKHRQHRRKTGLFFAEGVRVIETAVDAGCYPEYILFSEHLGSVGGGVQILDKLQEISIPHYQVKENLFSGIADSVTPQGIVGVFARPPASWESIPWNESEVVIVICDRIRDPGNLGSIIRTAAACGCAAVISTAGSVDAFSPKVIRSSAGALFKLPVVDSVEVGEILQQLTERKVRLVSADRRGNVLYYRVDLRGKVALAIGNETQGVDERIREASAEKISIPLQRDVESLNASIAAAVLLYEGVRQRQVGES